MKSKKMPMRMCTSCREMKPKKELQRVVHTPEGDVKIDRTGKMNGRGAYICKNAECMAKARKIKALERALECAVSDEIYAELCAEAENSAV